MSFKNHLGRIAFGVAGAFGAYRGIPPEKNPAFIEAREKETDPDQERDSSDPSSTLPFIREKGTVRESQTTRVTKQIEELPTDLPPLRGIPEQMKKPSVAPERTWVNPYANLDGARAFVVGIFGNLGRHCVDRSATPHPTHDIPENAIAIASEEIGSYEDFERSFRIAVHAISNEEWEELLSLMFHPKEQYVEMIPEPELAQIIDPLTVAGDKTEIQKHIAHYIALLQLARVYLHAGLTREEIRFKLEEQAKKKEESKHVAQI